MNRRLIKLHQDSPSDVVYKVLNPYAAERCLYFISDPPHLLKTMRNCLKSRHFWVNPHTHVQAYESFTAMTLSFVFSVMELQRPGMTLRGFM